MKKFLLLFGIGLMLSLGLTGPLLALADEAEAEVENPVVTPIIPQPDFLPSPDVSVDAYETQKYILNEAIPVFINITIGVLALTAFLGILISAIQMLTAYGNEDKLNRAKTNLRYALIGLLVVILSYAIVSVIVSVTLPKEQDQQEITWIPVASALDVTEDVETLFPNQRELIEEQDKERRVSLPGGNFLGEIVPAIVTNLMYVVGFLIFIAFMYGGVLLVIGRGNEESLTKAKNILIYAGIALGLVSLGFALVYGIATLNLGANTLKAFAAIQLDETFRPENLPTYELAEPTDPDNPETAATYTISLFIGKLVSKALLFVGALAIFFLILSGANYIFAFGKDERIEKGKRGIFWSLMGLIVILLSYAIVQGIIQLILKVDETVN